MKLIMTKVKTQKNNQGTTKKIDKAALAKALKENLQRRKIIKK
jgi:hypothetical protein